MSRVPDGFDPGTSPSSGMLSPGGWDAMRALTLMIEQMFYSSRGQVGQIFEFGITGDIWDNEYTYFGSFGFNKLDLSKLHVAQFTPGVFKTPEISVCRYVSRICHRNETQPG